MPTATHSRATARDELFDRKVAVVGLGKSGLAAIELCLKHGAKVSAFDQAAEEQLGPTPAALRARGVALSFGELPEGFWNGADAVVVSPGVPLSMPALVSARAAGVPVFGEVELAARLVAGRERPVIGITGTNGKSTRSEERRVGKECRL